MIHNQRWWPSKGDFKVFDRADVDNDGNLELDEWHDFLETAAVRRVIVVMNMLSRSRTNLAFWTQEAFTGNERRMRDLVKAEHYQLCRP